MLDRVVRANNYDRRGLDEQLDSRVFVHKSRNEDYQYFSDSSEKHTERRMEDSEKAYRSDGLIAQAINMYSECYKGFRFDGENAKAIETVKKRLNRISLANGKHYTTIIESLFHETWKLGNGFLAIKRGNQSIPANRCVYEDRPYAISGFEVISARSLQPETVDGVDVWSRRDKKPTNLISNKAKQLLTGDCLISKFEPSKIKEHQYMEGMDLFHFAYKEQAENRWGFGLNFASLEATKTLRALEAATFVMSKNHMDPLIHHKVLRGLGTGQGGGGLAAEIEKADQMHRNGPVGGVVVTGPNHEFDYFGSESHAMRMGEILKIFTNRVLSGIGVTPFLMGMETGTLGAAQAAKELTLPKKKQVIKNFENLLSFWVINQILYEEGFDPYTNENDRVFIRLIEVDEDEKIKSRNHWADLYAKGLVDLSEARKNADLPGMPNKALTHLNVIQIPLLKVKADSRGAGQDEKSNNGSETKAAKAAKAKEFSVPTTFAELDAYLSNLSNLYNLSDSQYFALKDGAYDLFPDIEAIASLLGSVLEYNE